MSKYICIVSISYMDRDNYDYDKYIENQPEIIEADSIEEIQAKIDTIRAEHQDQPSMWPNSRAGKNNIPGIEYSITPSPIYEIVSQTEAK